MSKYPDNWNQYLQEGDVVRSLKTGKTRQKGQLIRVNDYIPEDGPDAIAYMWRYVKNPQLIRSKHIKNSFEPVRIKAFDQIHYSIW